MFSSEAVKEDEEEVVAEKCDDQKSPNEKSSENIEVIDIEMKDESSAFNGGKLRNLLNFPQLLKLENLQMNHKSQTSRKTNQLKKANSLHRFGIHQTIRKGEEKVNSWL